MLAQVEQLEAFPKEQPRLLRQDDLPPMGRRRDAGAFVHVDADIALLREPGCSGVQADPDPDRSGCDGLLGLIGRRHGL